MKNTENRNERCNDCEQMFEDNVNGIVNEVDGYTRKDHRQKSEEVHDAYDKQTPTTGYEAGKPSGKTSDNVTSKIENGVNTAATKAKEFTRETADKAATKIRDGVKTAADKGAQFADKAADKINSKIDNLGSGHNGFDKTR